MSPAISPQLVVVYGGPGTGKTLNEQALKDFFQCEWVYHDILGSPQPSRKQAPVTRCLITMLPEHIGEASRKGHLDGAAIINVEAAALLLGDKWITPIPNYRPTK